MRNWHNIQRKILAFQFLSVAVSFAGVGRTTRRADICEDCLGQMNEAYNVALLLSTRASLTNEDCGVFDSASSYVQESSGAIRERIWRLRSEAVDPGPDISETLKEWEPIWESIEFDRLSEAAFTARAVRGHLRKMEDAIHLGPRSLSGRTLASRAIAC
jgi:hypothetical protein